MTLRLPTEQIDAIVATLPVAPRILAELMPRLQRVDVDLTDVAALIRRDAGLTARLIAAANSAAYTGGEPSASLEAAVGRIGYRETYRIIGAVASSQLSNAPLRIYGMPPHRLRENALFAALVMEELAPKANLEPRAAYTAGLLRSIGKPVLDRFATTRGNGRAYEPGAPPLAEWELAEFGDSNPEIGAYVLHTWRFPGPTVEAVRTHYHPADDPLAEAHLLNIAAGAADLRGYGFPGEEAYWTFAAKSFAVTGVDEGDLVWAGEQAHRALTRISAALA